MHLYIRILFLNVMLVCLASCQGYLEKNPPISPSVVKPINVKTVSMLPIASSEDKYQDIDKSSLDKKKTTDHAQHNALTVQDNRELKSESARKELKCLAQTLYFEARGEPYRGQVAVGNVVINRVKSRHFPNTICGVMKERNKRMCQFSFMCNGQIHKKVKPKVWQKSYKLAQDILVGKTPKYARGALFFHAKYLKMRVSNHRYTAKIGQHYFYK